MCERCGGDPDRVVYDRERDELKDPSGYLRVYPCGSPAGVTWIDADAVTLTVDSDPFEIPVAWIPTVVAALQAAAARAAPLGAPHPSAAAARADGSAAHGA